MKCTDCRHFNRSIIDGALWCEACAADHEQLAEWLRELKERRVKDESEGSG